MDVTETVKKNLSDLIKAYRKEAHEELGIYDRPMSCRKFAEKLQGVGYNALRSWEQKESLPELSNFLALAKYSKMSCGEFLSYLAEEDHQIDFDKIVDSINNELDKPEKIQLLKKLFKELDLSLSDRMELIKLISESL